MSATRMAERDDGPRVIVTFWPGRPGKSVPGTMYPLAGAPVDPDRQARELVRLWREFRRKGVVLPFPVVAKRSPVPRLIARVRGHARAPRIRRRTRRCSSSSRGSPDDDGGGPGHARARGGAR